MNRKGQTELIPTKQIKISDELKEVQGLMPIDQTDRENLKEDIKKHGIREPLKGYKKGKTFYILAGANRYAIANELGIENIDCEVLKDLPPKERQQFCIDDNLNRRHLTRSQKRELINREIKKDPERSNRSIADKTQADHKTVSTARKKLEEAGEIPQVKSTKGKDGKSYKNDRPEQQDRIPGSDVEINEEIKVNKKPLSLKQVKRDIERLMENKSPKLRNKYIYEISILISSYHSYEPEDRYKPKTFEDEIKKKKK